MRSSEATEICNLSWIVSAFFCNTFELERMTSPQVFAIQVGYVILCLKLGKVGLELVAGIESCESCGV